jgi:hypothetical protein
MQRAGVRMFMGASGDRERRKWVGSEVMGKGMERSYQSERGLESDESHVHGGKCRSHMQSPNKGNILLHSMYM